MFSDAIVSSAPGWPKLHGQLLLSQTTPRDPLTEKRDSTSSVGPNIQNSNTLTTIPASPEHDSIRRLNAVPTDVMDSTMEGGGRTSEGGRLSRRKITDVTLPNGEKPRKIDRAPLIDYATRAGVNFDKLPQLPFFAGLSGYSESWWKSVIGADLSNISATVGRPLTPEEAQGIAKHSSKKCNAAAHYDTVSASIAALFVVKGFDKSRFPFYTPKPSTINTVTKNWFPRLGIQPAYASLVWHSLRFMSYVCVIKLAILNPVFATVPGIVYAAGVMNDKKLEGLTTEMTERAKAQKAARRLGIVTPKEALPKYPTRPVNASSNVPIGGSEQWGAEGSQSVAQQDDQGWRTKRDSPIPTQVPAPEPPRRSDPSSRYEDDDDNYLFDDASPVAKTAKVQEQNASASSSGSAWSRIRAQAAASRSRDQATSGDKNDAFAARASSWEERRQQSLGGGSYTNSQPEDENVARSREQAQKEFDAMLERERRNE